MIKNFILVGLGGSIGSMGRYGVYLLTKKLAPALALPLGTLVVNVMGCFAIGCVVGILSGHETSAPHARLFFVVGILGGFTTFSAFGLETLQLISTSQMFSACLYVSLSIILGVLATWLGYQIFT